MKLKFILKSILFGSCILFISSCVKDKGNYDFAPTDGASVRFKDQGISGFVGDSIKYQPTRTFKDKNDSVYFDHAWYISGKLYSTTPDFKYYASEFTGFPVKYYMTDRRNGLVYATATYLNVTVSSPFTIGWSVLYQDAEGNSEVGHIAPAADGKYIDYVGLYQQANNEPMGKLPYKIFPYTMRGNSGIFVVQNGGQGAMDLGGNDYKKKLVASKSFTREVPNPFEPVDLAFFNATDLLVNSNGDMYGRFFNGAAIFTIPWMSSSLSVEKGMKVTDIWDSWYKTSNIAMMYDKLNKRMLYADGSLFYPGGGIVIRQLPLPKDGYGSFTSLQNLGNWEYIWGSSFIDNYNNIVGGMLIKSPDDNKIYFQNFDFKTSGPTLTPLKRIPFLGSDLVDSKSIYQAVRNRNYLFFTAAGAKDLYFFDVETGAKLQLYEKFTEKITTVEVDHDAKTIAVGLENGTVIIYDISNEVLLSGKSKELHRLTGLGKVVHVAYKSRKI